MVNYEKTSLLLNLECIALWISFIFNDNRIINISFGLIAICFGLLTAVEYRK